MRVLILVNTLNHIQSFIYSNHVAFFVQCERDFPRSSGNAVMLFTPPRMSIDMARNTAAKEALRRECDYLMFVDDDVLIPPDSLKRLISLDADVAAGLVIIRGYPFNVMAFKRDEKTGKLAYFNDLPKVDITTTDGYVHNVLKDPVTEEDGLGAVGFSCALLKTDLLRKIDPPFFITGPRGTEDVYYCNKAAAILEREDKKLNIKMMTSLQCGHQLHPEPIEWSTIDEFREHFKNLDPAGCAIIDDEKNGNRDANYINRCLGAL